MNVPKLRFPEFIEEWCDSNLLSVAFLNPKNEKLPSSFLYIDLESVKKGQLIKNSIIKAEGAPSRAKRILKYNDIIFQMVRPYQKNNLLFKLNQESVASTGYTLIRVKNIHNPQFLFQLLHNTNFVNQVINKCDGGNYPAINIKSLKTIPFFIPTKKDEEDKIADFINSTDLAITQRTKKRDLLLEYKKGVIQKIFSQEIRFKDDDGNDFEDWKPLKLKNIAELKNGYAFKSTSYDKDGIFKIITITNVQEGYLDMTKCNYIVSKPNNLQDHQSLKINDILISMTGNVGRTCKVNEENLVLNQRVGIIVPKTVSINFLFTVLNTTDFKNKMKMKAQGAAQDNLKKGDIDNYPFNCPISKTEQDKIANFITSIDEKIEQEDKQIEILNNFKKGLLQQMFI